MALNLEPSPSCAFFVYCRFHCIFPCMQLQGLQKRLSGINGMEQWNRIVEWNTRISFNFIFVGVGYFSALQIWILCGSAIHYRLLI